MLEYTKETSEFVVNRNHKDRLFKMIFGSPDHKDWTLSLYNAVNGSNYDNPDDIVFTTIENAVYISMANDVSFLVDDTMSLYEHQSTYNPNIPMRMLIYSGMLFSKYAESETNTINLLSKTLQKFPVPKLICFYNGENDIEDRIALKLSDAFEGDKTADIEAKVTMLNINYGRNRELMNACKALRDYSYFIEVYRKEYKEGRNPDRAIERAINELPDESEIKEFILDNKREVKMSVITEYNEERTHRLLRAEGRAEGEKHGESKVFELQEKLLDMGRDEDVKKIIKDPEYRNELYKEFGLI